MNKKIILAVAFGVSTIVAGCATSTLVVKSDPKVATAKTEYFAVGVTPACDESRGCNGFHIALQSTTDKNIEINWNKTLYISGGQTNGGFMFAGVVYKDRNQPKAPDIVFAKGLFQKTIWPNNLVDFTSGRYGGWMHGLMPAGENGVYLTVSVDGKEFTGKLVTNITITRVEPK